MSFQNKYLKYKNKFVQKGGAQYLSYRQELINASIKLVNASAKGDDDKVRDLLLQPDVISSLNIPSVYFPNNTALIFASINRHVSVIDTLIQAGADVNIKNWHGDTALVIASDKGHETIANSLIRAGASLDLQNNVGDTALMRASGRGHVAIVKSLLIGGASLAVRNNAGKTALMMAQDNNRDNIVKLIKEWPLTMRFAVLDESKVSDPGIKMDLIEYLGPE